MDETIEPLDVLDAGGLATGVPKARRDIHRDGDWHRAVHVWVVREGSLVLLQRRAASKELEPNRVDVTVGGHVRAGESAVDAALRETAEELGVDVTLRELVPLGTWRSERRYPDAVDREFQDTFALVREEPMEAYGLDCREVFQLYELPLWRALRLFRDGGHAPAAGWDCQGRPNHALLIEDDLIAQARVTTCQQLEALAEHLGIDPGPRE